MSQFQEDTPDSNYSTTELNCLISYNYYRVWGVNKSLPQGESDGQSIVVLFNKAILASTHPELVTATGAFAYDEALDHFIHRGLKYTPQGDTFLSQTNNDPLLFMFILERDRKDTGIKKGSL